MKKIDLFTNCYSLKKTLRFSLLPIGKTEEIFNEKLLLEEDEKRASNYEKVKKHIDEYHRYYIEKVLSKYRLEGVREYADLYYKANKSPAENRMMEKQEAEMRKALSKALISNETYKAMFSKEMIREILPDFLSTDEELEAVSMFYNFSTYFVGFNNNRKNIYSDEEKSTAISYRCINDNLPKFLDNSRNFKKILSAIPQDIEVLNSDCDGIYGVNASDVFNVDYFSFVISQSGIDKYNGIIGGYTCEDGTKIKGLNEYINLYNQKVAAKDKSKRLPLIKLLYKQILTVSKTVSFVSEKFKSDNEAVFAVNEFYNGIKASLSSLEKLFSDLNEYNPQGIFVKNGQFVRELSNAVFGAWNVISDAWHNNYRREHPLKAGKDEEKYYENASKEYKKIKSFSIKELQNIVAGAREEAKIASIIDYYIIAIQQRVSEVYAAYNNASLLLTSDYEKMNTKKLCKNDTAIGLIKTLLDSIKELEYILKGLLGSGKEENKDDTFYGEFLPLYDAVSSIDKLYDKVRNYVTQKPYSKDKIKLNFENSNLMGGWDKNKECDCRSVILIKNNKYYLAIMDKSNKKIFMDLPYKEGEDCYQKVEYKLLPDPSKMLPKVSFARSNSELIAPSEEILEIRRKGSFKKCNDFVLADCHKMIDFYKDAISKYNDWAQFDFEFAPTESYNDISEFYNDVERQGYKIKYSKVSCAYIDEMVESGQLYLFQIYNKDFSSYSHGNKNLHTLYFKMLFNEKNLADVVYRLNGGAEMFYRRPSISDDEKIVHTANKPIDNKNSLNSKKESLFEYDIIKDKRFTKPQFSLHLPITLNFKAKGQKYINDEVRLAVKNSDNNYIIGIDRGERNLLYICVIDEKGKIVEQKSLNSIISNNGYRVDFHNLLDTREKERDKARKSWGTVESIKELKEGYLSQVIHEICNLVVKYDAVIAMENLNFGFKNGRFKVEKQVYQKFENMLITKLNYLVDKKVLPDENGGLLKAYQLTNEFNGVNRERQNGIIFYVPAWLTSKIDPKTGFVNLLNSQTKYTSVDAARSFVEKIDDIRYNAAENIFEFDIDYSNFERAAASYVKKWRLCSNGERIINFRNPERNNEWDNKTVILTDEFKKLFADFGISDYSKLKESILSQSSKEFFKKFLYCISNVLQMRNSIVGSDIDYLISPVKGADGTFFDSRKADNTLPQNADANGAYNIARKTLWAIRRMKESDASQLKDLNLSITNAEWLRFAQDE